MKVLFIAAEADPFVKIGGLGDVAGSLPLAIQRQAEVEVDIRLIIPFHDAIKSDFFSIQPLTSFAIESTSDSLQAEVYTSQINGLSVYLISGPPISSETQVYAPDASLDGFKYTFFSLAALQLTRELEWHPDMIHANDWHTAPAIYALNQARAQLQEFQNSKTLLALHNLPYLGVGAGAAMQTFGLPAAIDSPLPWWAQDLPLPLGLLSADHIVTVSPTYAREILTPEFGSGLHEFLQLRSGSISGILNGIDTESWNPATDAALETTYTVDSLAARQTNKVALQKELELKVDSKSPLLAMITRLDPQKGVDLIPQAFAQIANQPWQFVILGTGVPELEQEMRWLQAQFPGRVKAEIRYDFDLSRRIYGGADAILIPSRYEPCGLTQMIAMRYGCVPIARATGGLKDTIVDYDLSNASTGFLFDQPSTEELADAISRALVVYSNSDFWSGLQLRGMNTDFSWDRSAKQYLALYNRLVDQ